MVKDCFHIFWVKKITASEFKEASALEKDAIIHALIKRSAREYKSSEAMQLYLIYDVANDAQRENMACVFANCLQKGYTVHYLNWIYSTSNEKQKAILAPAIAQYLKQRQEPIFDLASIYAESSYAEKEILFPHIVKYVEKECSFWGMRSIWSASHDAQRDVLLHVFMTIKKR